MHTNIYSSIIYNSENWKHFKCSSTNKSINKLCYSDTMEYYWVVKKKKEPIYASIWMNLKNIRFSDKARCKRSQIV